ncbi:MAG: GatB/YqeY domain-containing protein [bacterium]|jgi:hypothetical protein|nr:GatB/YqeY domain-containing protein [bacterium]
MASLHEQLRAELTAARKAQQKPALLLLGTILADIENAHIAAKRDLTEADVVDVLRKGIKRRRESQDAYEKGGRAELAAQERDEAAMLTRFLPPEASEDDVRAAVKAAIAAGAANVGVVMGKVMPQFKGRIDGGVINRVAREELGPTA